MSIEVSGKPKIGSVRGWNMGSCKVYACHIGPSWGRNVVAATPFVPSGYDSTNIETNRRN
jgi:hypothetical protein